MIPLVQVSTNPIEYYKAFLDMPKPPVNNRVVGKELDQYVKLSTYIANHLNINKNFTISNVEREPTLNRVSVCFNRSSNEYTDHALRLDDTREIAQLSTGRPLVIEVLDDSYGNSFQMTPATGQAMLPAIFIVFNGCIYLAHKTANINLLYALYSELYFLKFGGLPVEDGEFRAPIKGSRMAFFYKTKTFEDLLTKYGVKCELR